MLASAKLLIVGLEQHTFPVSEAVEQLEVSYIIDRSGKLCTHFKKSFGSFLKS